MSPGQTIKVAGRHFCIDIYEVETCHGSRPGGAPEGAVKGVVGVVEVPPPELFFESSLGSSFLAEVCLVHSLQ